MTLTKPQTAALRFFLALADKAPRPRTDLDPRTLKALRERGLLEATPGLHGPTHRITNAGRAALSRT